LPDGKPGPGLFSYLRSLQVANGGDGRDLVRTVFLGTINRMINGYLLRDVINKVGGICFTSTEEIFTLGHLYEAMLKEMRDAAGENGEFSTPRPPEVLVQDILAKERRIVDIMPEVAATFEKGKAGGRDQDG
jgi:type I restriction enzyme M protein